MPRPDIDAVFRIRRHQPTRLEGFVDAAFAFAVTFLVISIGHVPTSVPEMLHALRGIPTFAICFLLIVRFWNEHRAWSRRYDIEDATAIRLSLVLVFLVLIFVYPLRLLFSLLAAWLSHGFLIDLAVELHDIEELRWGFEVYGIGFCAITTVIALLYRHALRHAGAIGLDTREVLATRMHMMLWFALAGVAFASALIAALLPFRVNAPLVFTLPGMIYPLMSFIAPRVRRHYARRIAAAAPAPT